MKPLTYAASGVIMLLLSPTLTLALPPAEETPEEVLRTEIILDARSPVNGEPLTAAEYAELQQTLTESPYPPELSPEVQQTIFMLKLLDFINTILPF
ncbi:hypothetical protein PN462_01835 [Spirulina sp. CS-785/01]|uniref:hypothetical protein n=1 Tax=Spirulina sp. CS-785/01 TaxID=3021716 RepID=UPI0023304D16|nr:hypothetical protein [Spirulina sp. CS-785/01]MDB9311825.1 hypothetical protein [Spirulina sp. CS-785/01]